jgi:hypothetical protein
VIRGSPCLGLVAVGAASVHRVRGPIVRRCVGCGICGRSVQDAWKIIEHGQRSSSKASSRSWTNNRHWPYMSRAVPVHRTAGLGQTPSRTSILSTHVETAEREDIAWKPQVRKSPSDRLRSDSRASSAERASKAISAVSSRVTAGGGARAAVEPVWKPINQPSVRVGLGPHATGVREDARSVEMVMV